MDVRNAKIEPTIEHGGTCRSFFLIPKESLREATEGSYLEFVSDFVGVPVKLIGVGPGREQVIWTEAAQETLAARAVAGS